MGILARLFRRRKPHPAVERIREKIAAAAPLPLEKESCEQIVTRALARKGAPK
jgi:hypothetical protein